MKARFPISYHGHKLDYAKAMAYCLEVAADIKRELRNPKREKGVVQRKIFECASILVDNLGFPEKIVSRYMKYAMPGISPSTINDALPGRMKEPRMAAIARAKESNRVTGDFHILSGPRSDDDFARYEIVLHDFQLPEVERAIAAWKRSGSECAILHVSDRDELFMISVPDDIESENGTCSDAETHAVNH